MFTGLKYDALQEGYEVWVEGRMVGFRVWDVAAQRLLESRTGQTMAAQSEVEPVTVTERHRKPCAWYRSIKRFYAIAGERGLDCKAEERMRGAVSALLGRHIGSRSELTAGEWTWLGDACKNAALCW